jgi:hypothetical protein
MILPKFKSGKRLVENSNSDFRNASISSDLWKKNEMRRMKIAKTGELKRLRSKKKRKKKKKKQPNCILNYFTLKTSINDVLLHTYIRQILKL